ncbi:MAG: tetratricopeptide repeat protein, partial [Bdellovibrio sp.]
MQKWIFALSLFALVGCTSLGQKNKEKAELYFRLGSSHIEAENYPLALRELLKAEELDPANAAIQNNLGLVYFYREHFVLSEKHFSEAIKLLPQYSEARNNLARLLIEKSDYAGAEKELSLVLEDLTYPQPEKAYINLGLAKFNQKNYSGAREAFSKALRSVPDDCIASTYFGRTYFETGDYAQATEALDRAIGFCQKLLYDEPHYYSALAYYRL